MKKRLLRGKHKERAILYFKKYIYRFLCTLETISKIKIKTIQEKGFVLRKLFPNFRKKKRKDGFGPFEVKIHGFCLFFKEESFILTS